jgi:hypothetical protein
MLVSQIRSDVESIALYTMPAESSGVTMVGAVPVENPPGYEYTSN